MDQDCAPKSAASLAHFGSALAADASSLKLFGAELFKACSRPLLHWGGSLLLLAIAAFPVRGAELQTLRGNLPPGLSSLKPTGHWPATNRLNLAIGLHLRNPAGLSNLLQQIYDPASSNYHHYLTPAKFTEDFGPTERDYQALIAFARAHHLQVTTTHPNRLLLDVSGTVAEVEQALHVTLYTYQHPTEKRIFYAPDRNPTLDLAVPVLHISGLDNYALPRPHLHAARLVNGQNATPNTGSGPSGTYMGLDFRAAYVPNSTLNGGGQAVGLLQFDGYTASDITYYESLAGLPIVPLQNVLVDGATGKPSGSGGELEVSLDIEMAISMATNLSKVIVYMAPNPSPFVDLLNRMANDNLAKQLSCSWYVPNGVGEPAADLIFQQMAAQGQSFFCASGDYDAYTGLIPFPSDDLYVTEVGGTMLTTTGPRGAWVSETAWNRNDGIGTGGGISTEYSIPSWQTNISMAANQGSTTKRNVPDVALTAESVYVRVDGFDYKVGGTSCASPLWAGFAALVNQQAVASGQPTIGFINPAVDAIGSGANYTAAFHDITVGNNISSSSPSKFYAVAGYDLCTGWGTPAGQDLVNALANPEPLLITPATGFTAFGGVGGPFFPVTSQNYALTNGGTNALSWTLSNTSVWLNVSSSAGTLLPGGAAAALTVSLNNAASNLLVGTYAATLWWTNQLDNQGQSRQFALSIINPPSITQQPTNQGVLEGAAASFNVQATGGLPLAYQWQLNSTNLTDNGNLYGSASSNLTIIAVSAANVGNYTVVVTNFAGLVASSNAALTITPSPPVIIIQPTNQTVYANILVQLSVSTIGTTPLAYQWSFNSTNLVNATNATLTLTNIQLNQSGAYSVLVTNSYGSTNSAAALVTVIPPPPCEPLPAGIVAWWRGESNALDTIGGNNGTLMNGTTFTNGEVGTAFRLNGLNNYVLANPSSPSSLDVGQGSGLTFEEWIYPNTVSTEELLVEYERALATESGSDVGIALAIHAASPGGILYANLTDTTGAAHIFASPQNLLTSGAWQHIAMTYDQASGLAAFYINGVSVTLTNVGSFSPQTSFTNLVLGARTTFNSLTSPGAVYSGRLDEVSLYNRALSASEIFAIYQAGFDGKCFTPTPPAIASQPTNQVVPLGETAIIAIVANGTPPLIYQWSCNGTNLATATNATLTLTNVQLNQSGSYAVSVTNAYGWTNSAAALLTVLTSPPTITSQPTNASAVVGGTAFFSVGASGTSPLTYQWSFNGTNLLGATNAALTLTNLQINQSGSYAVLVTNLFGWTNSAAGILTVYGLPPLIVAQPVNQTVLVGSAAGFSVTASGTLPLSYQWSCNGTNLANATNSTLSLVNLQLTNSGSYSVLVTNLYGWTNSAAAVLTVNVPPPCDPLPAGIVAWWQAESNALDTIGGNNGTLMNGTSFAPGEVGTAFNLDGNSNFLLANPTIPSNFDVGQGSGLTFEEWINPNTITTEQILFEYERAFGTGSGYDDGILLAIHSDSGGVLLANLVDTNYVSHMFASPAGALTARVWQHIALTYDKASGIATLCINGTAVTVTNFGRFTPLTSFTNFLLGATATFGSASSPSAVYSGKLDEISLYNRALSSDEIAAIYLAGGSGKCLTQNPPTIITQPANQTTLVGGMATFAVSATGSQPLNYQWSVNGTNLLGATNATLTLTNLQINQSGNYAVLVTNLFGSTNSAAGVLTVYGLPPQLTTQPSNQTMVVGSTAVFSVNASGTAPLAYQWSVNGTNLLGATNAALTLTNLQINQSGSYAVLVTNLFGWTNSTAGVLTVYGLPPVIVAQPTNQTVLVGSAAAFSITASGTSPLNYQWSCNGTNLANATNSTLSLVNLQLTDNGSYSVLVTNFYGSTNSFAALLTVNPLPPCDPLPAGIVAWWQAESNALDTIGGNNGILMNGTGFASGEVGTAFELNGSDNFVLANPSAPSSLDVGHGSGLTFEEWINPNTITTEQILFEYERAFGTGTGYDDGILLAIHSDSGGILLANLVDTNYVSHIFASPAGALTASVWQHIALTYDKTSGIAMLCINGTAVTVTNCGSFTPLTSFTNFLLGATATFGSVSSPSAAYSGQLDEISLYNRALSSNEIAAIYLAGSAGKCSTPTPPAIITQPTNQSVQVGGTASLTVVASGTPPLSYQWNFNGTNVLGATNAVLNLTNLQINQSGNYAVLVTNLFGSTNSATSVLTVYGLPPQLTTQPSNQTMVVGSTAVFSVNVSGSAPLAYQWNFNGTNLFGATNAALTLANLQINQSGSYAVLITNLFGSTNSAAGVLTVYGLPPSITVQPVNQTVVAGATAAFSVTASGTAPLAYQWNFNGTNLAYATNATLTLLNAQTNQTGSYSVLVTNLYGSTNSGTVVLTVNPVAICNPSPSGLVSWWAAERNALDSVGLNNGTLVNGTSFTNGEVGTAFNLNGNNNYVLVVSSNLNVGAATGLTFEEWINPITVSSEQILLEYERRLGTSSGTDIGVALAIHAASPGGLLYVNITDTNVAGHIFTSPAGILTAGVWQHIALTYDKASGIAAFYINGTAVTVTNVGVFTPQTTFSNLLLGAHTFMSSASSPSKAFSGRLDEISLYNRALAASEIAAIYQAGSNGKCPLPPAIFSQPTNLSVSASGTATFNVVAGGTPTLKYQWSCNGTNLVKGTNALLTLTGVQLTNAGSYSVQVSNGAGATNSANALLTVQAAPGITAQPANQTVAAGGNASFSVTASGTAPLSYQWCFNGTNVAGGTNVVLTLANIQLTNSGNYSVRVTNLFGSATSSNALLTVLAPPAITQPPANSTNVAGSTAIFFATASGTAPLAYQWQKNGGALINGGNVTGAATTILTLAGVQDADAASYALVVTNIAGSITSAPALLVVLDPPAITLQPTNQFVRAGSNAVLVAAASGAAPLGCQWLFNGTNLWDSPRIVGAQDCVLIISNALIRDTGFYQALFTNSLGSATSSVAVLMVGRPPQVITPPASHSAPLGCTVSFSVMACGSQPLADQWWKDGSLLNGQTNATLTVANFQSTDLGGYSVVVTNDFGSVTSAPACLSVGYHPPVAGADVVQRFAAGGVRIKASDLLANDVDTNGDSLAIVSVSANSTAGGTVSLTNNWIYYAPPAGWTNADWFTYTVSDGLCGTDVGSVLVQIADDNPQPAHFGIGNQAGGPVQLSFTGIPGNQYQLQYADSLVNPNWQVLTTQSADCFGVCQFTDPSSTNTVSRYYRAVPVSAGTGESP